MSAAAAAADASRAELKLSFIGITKDNVGQLRALNQAVFPVRYGKKFYEDVLKPEVKDLVHLAFHNSSLVGAICCRFEEDKQAGGRRVYIMTLGVLAPYRGLGVGSRLLQAVLSKVQGRPDITQAYLHVQVNNEGALSLYKRNGFTVGERVENYYRRLDPSDCFLVSKTFTV